MLDVLLAVVCRDYDDRRCRPGEGAARTKAASLQEERLENKVRKAAIATTLREGQSWREIMEATECSRTLLAELARDLKLGKPDNRSDCCRKEKLPFGFRPKSDVKPAIWLLNSGHSLRAIFPVLCLRPAIFEKTIKNRFWERGCLGRLWGRLPGRLSRYGFPIETVPVVPIAGC